MARARSAQIAALAVVAVGMLLAVGSRAADIDIDADMDMETKMIRGRGRGRGRRRGYVRQGPKCSARDGRCIDLHKDSCPGETPSGLCPGAANIKCCIEREAADERKQELHVEHAIEKETGHSVFEGGDGGVSEAVDIPENEATIDDAVPCKHVRGICKNVDTSECTTAPFISGECPGAANVKCCPAEPPPPGGFSANTANVETTVKLVPAVPYDSEPRSNPFRVRRDSFGNLKRNSPLRVEVASSKGPGTNWLHKLCADRFNRMREAAQEEKGIDFKVASGWRRHRYKNDRSVYCAVMKRKYPSLTCGQAGKKMAFKSPHETGLAFDLGSPYPFAPSFSKKRQQLRSPAFAWLKQNAHKFGITPYKHEPWHWECVITRHGWQTGEEFVEDGNFAVRVEESRNDNGRLTIDSRFGS